MTQPVAKPKRKRASKEARQRQLILATIEAIAKHGLSDTRLSQVSKIAGLSQGIVNLHFQSKDTLLIETLKYLRDEYVEMWLEVLENSPDDPAVKLARLARLDFDRVVVDRKKLAVWFAFWGETKANQSYSRICKEIDDDYAESTTKIIAQLIDEGGYSDLDAEDVVTSFMALVDGLWLALHCATGPNRKECLNIAMQYLTRFFPRHADVFST